MMNVTTEYTFAEYRLFYRALLQKRPMVLESLFLSMWQLQGGEHAEDALSCRSLFAKELPKVGRFGGKMP